MGIVSKLNKILTRSQKKQLIYLSILLILLSILEFVSLGLIPIMVTKILDLSTLESFDYFFKFLPNIFGLGILGSLLILIVIIFIFKFFASYSINKLELDTIKNLRIYISRLLLHNYLNKEYNFFLTNSPSLFSRNLITETDNFVALMNSIMIITREVCLLLVVLLLLVIYEPLISISILSLLCMFALIFYLATDKILKSVALDRITTLANKFKISSRIYNLIKEIKIYNKEDFFLKKYIDNNKNYEEKLKVASLIRRLPKLFFELLSVIIIIFLIIYLNFTKEKDFISYLPFFSLVVISTVKLIPSFNSISGSLTHIQSYTKSFNLIYEEVNLSNTTQLKKEYRPIKKKSENYLEVKNLSFYYKSNKNYTLKNIEFLLPKGKMLGIIGKSGSGKTTLINILIDLIKPDEGEIKFFSENKNINLAIVPQDIEIFDDTLKNNIAFGIDNEKIIEHKIKHVIYQSGLDNFFKKNNKNVNLILGEKGLKISGGERQRVGIARALYTDPEFLIFDEATSSLDGETENNVLKNIKSLKGDITSIFISHKLSAMEICDDVLFLEDGRIIDRGNINYLIKKYPKLTDNEK